MNRAREGACTATGAVVIGWCVSVEQWSSVDLVDLAVVWVRNAGKMGQVDRYKCLLVSAGAVYSIL
jgi:hypothetical protein